MLFNAWRSNRVYRVRCHRPAPHASLLVVTLLDDRREYAPRADPVAPHDQGLLGPVLVEEGRLERDRVLRLELEDVTDLDRRLKAEPSAADGAGVVLLRGAEVGEAGLIVAAGLDAAEVDARPVRARDVLAHAERLVGDHLAVEADRSD